MKYITILLLMISTSAFAWNESEQNRRYTSSNNRINEGVTHQQRWQAEQRRINQQQHNQQQQSINRQNNRIRQGNQYNWRNY